MRRLAYEAADAGMLSPELAVGIRLRDVRASTTLSSYTATVVVDRLAGSAAVRLLAKRTRINCFLNPGLFVAMVVTIGQAS